MPVKTIEVKGTKYYQATAEVAKKRAREKAEVEFQRDPANQYDSNAVRVLLAENGAFLGYVPRTMSAHVSSQIIAGAIKKARIRSINKNSDYLKIKVTYEFEGPTDASAKPASSSIYASPPPRYSPPPRPAPQPSASTASSAGQRPVQQGHYAAPSAQPTSDGGGFGWGTVLLVVGGIILLMMLL